MSVGAWLVVSALSLGAGDDPAASQSAYRERAATVGRDPDAHARLALWCEAHGLDAERIRHLSMAVVTDPAHALARGLLGLVQDGGRWLRPEQVVERNTTDPERVALRNEYHARRSLAGNSADAQAKLGDWCESKGLAAESQAHYAMALRLDPGRADVWKKLGYRKHDGQWRTDAQIAAAKAEAKAQRDADRTWSKQLGTWKAMLGRSPSQREEAESALLSVDDPRAVPAVLKTFARDDPRRAVQLLGQIDAAAASQALAMAAVFASSEEIRRAAAETLAQRDPREYAGYLIGLLRDPIRYEVKPVAGPGSPGELWVEGKKADLKRVYAPPPPPQVMLMPGDLIGYDEFGLPVIHRTWQAPARTPVNGNDLRPLMGMTPPDQGLVRQIASVPGAQPLADFVSRTPSGGGLFADPRANAAARSQLTMSANGIDGGHYWLDGVQTFDLQIPVGRAMVEANRSAARAQGQLERDVASIESYNAPIDALNERLRPLLEQAAGRDMGPRREQWEAWWVDQLGYALRSDPNYKPTVVQNVPVAFSPPSPVLTSNFVGTSISRRMSCFAAGTPVWTADGLRPIEALQVGDLVLSQDSTTGLQSYQPVLLVHRNPPSPTLRVAFEGGDSVTASTYHRFWRAGRGWAMARELKPGDVLRTQSGLVRVEGIREGEVQPVFNLDVAASHSFFVGVQGALVHDNTLPDTRLEPFDRLPEIAQNTP